MTDQSQKVLLVEPDAVLLEMFVETLSRRFNPHITCVVDGASCLDVEMVDPHDLVIAEFDLIDSDGLTLSERLTALSDRPIILLADNATRDDAAEAWSPHPGATWTARWPSSSWAVGTARR